MRSTISVCSFLILLNFRSWPGFLTRALTRHRYQGFGFLTPLFIGVFYLLWKQEKYILRYNKSG